MCRMLTGWVSSKPSQEFDAIWASGWPPTPFRIAVSALNSAWRPKKPLLHESPPTTIWFACGARS